MNNCNDLRDGIGKVAYNEDETRNEYFLKLVSASEQAIQLDPSNPHIWNQVLLLFL
jgi:hypothetical protein